MSEEKQVKKQLLKNMILNLITFIIIFSVLGIIIYGQFKSSLYLSADSELEKTDTRREFRNENRFNAPDNLAMPTEEKNRPLDNLEENSPRLIFITRDSDGNILSNQNLNDIFENTEFDKTNLNNIYELSIEGYSYRGINYQNQDGSYRQILINVDSEKTIAERFIKNLVISFSIAVIIILIASYILSKWTLKPIIASWKKQTRFVQDASHELRTPLTIIKAKQESLLEKPESKIIDNAEDISITLQETNRLTKLIKELMELAKNDSDKLKLNSTQFNLDNEINQLVTLYRDLAEAEEKQLTASLDFKEEINADLNMLKELIVILLDNSIKYTDRNDTIEIKTYKQDNKAVIEVIDTGIGISKEAIDHIFERFYREEKSRNREKGGMGLGLSIAYNIVTLHKGTIKFDKNREKGTRVIVKLPIKWILKAQAIELLFNLW